MLARTPLWQLAIEWLETQPRGKRYSWNSGRDCACAQLAKAIGREREWKAYACPSAKDVARYYSDRGPGPAWTAWHILNQIAEGKDSRDWTFGAFLERVKWNYAEVAW